MILGMVKDAELPPIGRELFIRITKCSLSMFCNFGYFPLCLGGGTVILIEAVPGICLSVTI